MSCSITMIVCLPARLRSSSPVFAVSSSVMPAAGSSTRRSCGVLRQEHADFQPLFLAVGERSRLLLAAIAEADDPHHLVNALPFLRRRRGPRSSSTRRDFLQPQQGHSRRPCDRCRRSGVWKFRPMPRRVDFVFAKSIERRAFVLDLPGIRPGAPGDEIEECALTRAVRPDDCSQLSFIEVEVEIVDGLESIEALCHAPRR